MPRRPEALHTGPNYQSANFGAPSQWDEFLLAHPRMGDIPGKIFLQQVLGLTGMQVSLGSLPPGASIPFLHGHKQNEELYLVISGEGEMQVDGEVIPFQAGSAIRIAPAGIRVWRALGTEPMRFVVIQAREGSLEQHTATDGFIPDAPVRW